MLCSKYSFHFIKIADFPIKNYNTIRDDNKMKQHDFSFPRISDNKRVFFNSQNKEDII